MAIGHHSAVGMYIVSSATVMVAHSILKMEDSAITNVYVLTIMHTPKLCKAKGENLLSRICHCG